MAYKANFGNGALGDVENPDTTINSYARVTAVTPTTITINNTTKITGDAAFEAGAKILIHVSACASTEVTYLGNWLIANITAVNSNVFTLDVDPTACIPSEDLAKYYVQAIAIAQYKNLTLETGCVITPPVYSVSNYHGGIVAIMCSETLTFDGGNIALNERGIPVTSKSLRPVTQNDVAADTANYAGWENSDTHIHFMLNAGDGAAFIVAKKLVCSADSRIGNPATKGVQFYRGSSTSVTYNETKPSGVTNVGGSTILIAAETIENFSCAMIAKYRNSASPAGQGICRCYIASETKLRNDEGLYAYDCISTPSRIKTMNIKNFGNGSFGDVAGTNIQLNNYATITAVNGRKVTYKSQTTNGLAQIGTGALVMIHFNHKGSTNVVDSGRFILANVLGDNGSVLTLDTDVPNISVTDYAAQVIAIPQFGNFTLSVENKSTPVFNGEQGGICAIACKGTCNLSGGKLNVEQKGGGGAYARAGLAVIGNAQDSDKLPIGQGHGSVFILAEKLTVNANTRIGATGGGIGSVLRYNGGTSSQYFAWGSGANSGWFQIYNTTTNYGGYGSNGYRGDGLAFTSPQKAAQGAHIMIIADTISGLNQAAFSTGGAGGMFSDRPAGYGGSTHYYESSGLNADFYGAYNGGGTDPPVGPAYVGCGSSGWCFIYCNNAVNQDTTGTVRAN